MTYCEELGYIVGDLFCVNSSIFTSQTAMLVKDDGTNTPYFKLSNSGLIQCIKLERLTKITNTTEAIKGRGNMKDSKPDQYEIKLSSKLQLDVDRIIAEELTISNPIIVVELSGNDGKDFIVVVHSTLIHKAKVCDLMYDDQKSFIEGNYAGDVIFKSHSGKMVSDVIKHFRMVKNAKWPDSGKHNKVKAVVRKVTL